MVGLARGKVLLEPYNSSWKTEFETEKERLLAHLGDENEIILHIGSTAIPGMVAKPIIDILLISDQVSADFWQQQLGGLGYQHRENGDNDDSIFFAKGGEAMRTHYLRITYPHSKTHIGTIYFRDTLRTSKELADKYEKLKEELAGKYPDQRQEYSQGKIPFIKSVLADHPHL